MDNLSEAIKCGNCHNFLELPIILPCGDSICKKHTLDCKESILCHTCGLEHPLPANSASFVQVKALARVIDSRVGHLDFGNEHKEATKLCEQFDELLVKIEQIINDPFDFTYDVINALKSAVQLKGEEMIFKINENMQRIIGKLDEYKEECKRELSRNEVIVAKTNNLVSEKELGRIEQVEQMVGLIE